MPYYRGELNYINHKKCAVCDGEIEHKANYYVCKNTNAIVFDCPHCDIFFHTHTIPYQGTVIYCPRCGKAT